MRAASGQFDSLVRNAQHSPQIVTRNGKPVVVVLAAEEYVRLKDAERRRKSFAEVLLAIPRGESFDRIGCKPRDVGLS
jgi:prevent-host-death family protein